jgi:hypothetical protein
VRHGSETETYHQTPGLWVTWRLKRLYRLRRLASGLWNDGMGASGLRIFTNRPWLSGGTKTAVTDGIRLRCSGGASDMPH